MRRQRRTPAVLLLGVLLPTGGCFTVRQMYTTADPPRVDYPEQSKKAQDADALLAEQRAKTPEIGVAKVAGITIMATARFADGSFGAQNDSVTGLAVRIANESGSDLRLNHEHLLLVGRDGGQYAAIPPNLAVGAGYNVAYRYQPGGSEDNLFGTVNPEEDSVVYATIYGGDVRSSTRVFDNVLRAGQVVSGNVYFEPVPAANASPMDLVVDLVDASSGEMIGTATVSVDLSQPAPPPNRSLAAKSER